MSKHRGKYVAYYRVSTNKQGVKGLGIKAQKTAVQAFLNGGRWELVAEFTERESGRKTERTQLNAALRACRLYDATLIVAKLDRLARNAAFLKTIVAESGERGVVFCDMPHLPEGPQSKFVIAMMAEVAELEAGMISQRTKAALAEAKKRGVRLGGARANAPIKAHAAKGGERSGRIRGLQKQQRLRDVAPLIAELRERGVCTLQGIADELNRKHVALPRGGLWQPAQVRYVELHASSCAA